MKFMIIYKIHQRTSFNLVPIIYDCLFRKIPDQLMMLNNKYYENMRKIILNCSKMLKFLIIFLYSHNIMILSIYYDDVYECHQRLYYTCITLRELVDMSRMTYTEKEK